MGFATDAIHAGQDPDPSTGSVTTPIYQTSTFVQEGLGKHKGFEYARTGNPTRLALEKNIAVLEQGIAGFGFASGMAAITTVMLLLKSGDHVLVTDNVYGGTYRLFTTVLNSLGLDFTFLDTSNVDNVRSSIKPNTRMIFLETPTNPMMTLTDLKAIAQLAKQKDLLVAVDNTFMSPYFQKPIPLGADIVIHSTAKFLNGHSDGVGGVVVVSTKELGDKLGYLQNSAGAILAPFESWLVLRGIKTLALRMQRHNENAFQIAKHLRESPKVRKVFYPGLTDHPQHALAKQQCTGFGGMITFDVESIENAKKVVEATRVFALAESLGGVESLIGHPITMTHASVPEDRRKQLGLTGGIIRLSVGLEDLDDLIGDLDQALRNI